MTPKLFPSRRLHFQRDYLFHNFIVGLDRLDHLPGPVAFGLALVLPGLATRFWTIPWQFIFFPPAIALAIEAAALLSSRLPGRSPSPFAGPLALFSLGHGVAALVAAALLPPIFLAFLIHLLLQAGLLAAFLYGFFIEPRRVKLRHEEIDLSLATKVAHTQNKVIATEVAPTGSKSRAQEGAPTSFMALLLSDLHLDVPGPREAQVLAHARLVRPDLILIPGDLTNLSTVDHPDCAAAAVAFLRELAALAPVFVSRGTPEVDDPDWVRSLCASAGVTLLDGAVADFPPDRPAFTLIGVASSGPINPHREQLKALMATTRLPSILLYHTPDIIETAAACGVGLQVSGHTHGGQVRLPVLGPLFTASRYGRRFASGRFRVGPTELIVSRGVGMEGAGAPRLRFFCPPEVVAISIRA